MLRTWKATLLVLVTAVACSPIHSKKLSDGDYTTVYGRITLRKGELRLTEYSGMLPRADNGASCINVRMHTFADKERISAYSGRYVKMRARLIDYYREAVSDPIAATVDEIQNSCGNNFYLEVSEFLVR